MLKKITYLVPILMVLTGCGSTTDELVGVGRSTDEFTKSPCACYEMPLKPVDDDYIRHLKSRMGA